MNRIVLAPRDVNTDGVIIDDSGSRYRNELLDALNDVNGGHPGWRTVIDEENGVDWEFVDIFQDLTVVLTAAQVEEFMI